MFVGDVYSADDLPEVPASLEAAVDLFRTSEFVRTAFGDAVHRYYVRYFEVEIEAYQTAVTDWELKRYFERI